MATNRTPETSNYTDNDINGRNGDDNASNNEHNEVNLSSVCLFVANLSRRSVINFI